MKYELKSGTTVVITDDRMEIIRTGAKSAVKSLMAGRTTGETIITASAITRTVMLYRFFVLKILFYKNF